MLRIINILNQILLYHWWKSGQSVKYGYNRDNRVNRCHTLGKKNLIYCYLFAERKKVRDDSSSSSSILAVHMDAILHELQLKTTRTLTAKNYYQIWILFNNFIVCLNYKPRTWEHRLALYGGYLVEKKVQSPILKSYFSAIKKILTTYIGFELKLDNLLLNTLAKSCRLINDVVKTSYLFNLDSLRCYSLK